MKKNDSTPDIQDLWHRLEAGSATEVAESLGTAPNPDLPVVGRTLHGLAFYQAGRHGEAVLAFEDVLRAEPRNPLATLYLVLALYGAGRCAEAGRLLTAPETVIFPHRGWLLEFVRVFWPQRRTAGLEEAAILPPEDGWADPYAARWQAYQALPPLEGEAPEPAPDEEDSPGLIAELHRFAQSITSPAGKRRAIARKLARQYRKGAEGAYHARKLGHAVRMMERAHALSPHSQSVLGNLGYLYLVAGHPERAHALLEPFLQERLAAYEVKKDAAELPRAEVLICFAWALHEAGRHEEALQLLSAVQPEGPEDLGAHFVAAICWLALGREAEYREAFHLATTTYFIDTWEQLLLPFIHQVADWLGRQEN